MTRASNRKSLDEENGVATNSVGNGQIIGGLLNDALSLGLSNFDSDGFRTLFQKPPAYLRVSSATGIVTDAGGVINDSYEVKDIKFP